MKAIICATLLILGLANIEVAEAQRVCSCPPEPPVCGSDFKNYAGECNLNCEASLKGTNVYMIYNGPCEDLWNNNNIKPIPPVDPCNPCNIHRPDPCNPCNIYPPNPYNPYHPLGAGNEAPKGK